MENISPDVNRALTKICQAMDKLHSTRLIFQKDSPEWVSVLKAEIEVHKAISVIKGPH